MGTENPSVDGPVQYPERDSVEDIDRSSDQSEAGTLDERRRRGRRAKPERGDAGTEEPSDPGRAGT